MSIRIASIDLSSAIVGTTGTIQIPNPAVQVEELAHLRLYNESGCGLNLLFDNGHGETIPAGAWPMFEIEPTVRSFTWTVYYVLPNAPVTTVSGVYYFPYEGVPPTPALGNSPIGVTGTVTNAAATTLSNENNPANTEVIDIGTAAIAKLIDIFNDHFTWSVQQSGVGHTVLQGQNAGTPLLIGKAGDNTEVLGTLILDNGANFGLLRDNVNANVVLDASAGTGAVSISKAGTLSHILGTLTVDQATTLTGIVTAAAANLFGAVGVLTHILGTLTVDQATTLTGLLTATGQITGAAAQALTLNAVTGQQVQALINNSIVMAVDGGGLNFSSGKLFDTTGHGFADWTAGGVIIKGQSSNHNRFNYQGDGANTDWFINLIGPTVTGTVSATVNHLCKEFNVSTAPNHFLFNSATAAGSQTMGFNTITATQVNVVAASSNAWGIKGVLA